MKQRILPLVIILLIALCPGCHKEESLPQCEDPLACVDLEPGEAIRLGVLQALSGGNAENGRCQVRSVEMALADHKNTLLGHPVYLQVEDAGCTPEMGNAAAVKIALNLKNIGVIGTFCSSSAATASRVITDAGMVMISGSNSAPSLTSVEGRRGANWHAGYFRVMFNGTNMARATAHFAYEQLGLRRAAAINDGSLYTSEYTTEFARSFAGLGGSVVAVTSINKGDTDMMPAITSVVLAKAQCVYFPLYQEEAGHLVRQIAAVPGAAQMVFIGGGALLTETFLKNNGEAATGMYFSSVITPSGETCDRLKARYIERFGEPPQHFSFAHTYDAANLLLSAIENVAVKQPGGGLGIGRKALREALYHTQGFPGVTGRLSCNEFGDLSADKFKIMRLDDPSAGLEGVKRNIVYTYDPQKDR